MTKFRHANTLKNKLFSIFLVTTTFSITYRDKKNTKY